MKNNYKTETLYTTRGDAVRGTVQVKEKDGRLYALIGRRWCNVVRTEAGRLVEIWKR